MKNSLNTYLGVVLVMSLTLAACGSDNASDETSQPGVTDRPSRESQRPDDGPTPLIELGTEGGFVLVDFSLKRIPQYVLMTDGTLYAPGATPAIFPGPALPDIRTMQVDDEVLADVLQYIQDMGLADVAELRLDETAQLVADAPDTYVIYFDDAGRHKLSVYGLGLGEGASDAREAQLTGLIETLDRAASARDGERYSPNRLEVYALGADPAETERSSLPWPLDISYDEMFGDGEPFGCVLLEGEEATQVIDVFENADDLTRFDDGIDQRRLVARPLFDHQISEC